MTPIEHPPQVNHASALVAHSELNNDDGLAPIDTSAAPASSRHCTLNISSDDRAMRTPVAKTSPRTTTKSADIKGHLNAKNEAASDVRPPDPDDIKEMMQSRYYKIYRLDQSINRMADTTAELTQTLESIANNRQQEAESINQLVDKIDHAKRTANTEWTNFKTAATALAYRTLKTVALSGAAIGSLTLASSLAKQQGALTPNIDRGLNTSAYALLGLALAHIYRAPEVSQLSQTGRTLLTNLSDISASGTDLFSVMMRTAATILNDVGRLSEQAAATSDIARQALDDIRGV